MPQPMKRSTTASLMMTITLLTLRRLLDADDEQGGDQRDDEHRRQIEDRRCSPCVAVGQRRPTGARVRGACHWAGMLMPRSSQEGDHVARPADRDRRRAPSAYSRIRSQPMIQATSSPSVA